MKIQVTNNSLKEVEDLAEEVRSREFSFESELVDVQGMDFDLEAHPEEDLAGFNELYAAVQGNLNRATSIIISIYQEKAVWQKFQQRVATIYRKKRTFFMSQDTTKVLKNKELQEAAVHEQMPEVVSLKEIIENTIENLELLIDIVEERRDNLDKLNTNLSRQQKIVESLIGLNYPVIARAAYKER